MDEGSEGASPVNECCPLTINYIWAEGKGLAERETHSTKLELLKSKGSSKAEMIRRMRAEAKLKAARQKEAR